MIFKLERNSVHVKAPILYPVASSMGVILEDSSEEVTYKLILEEGCKGIHPTK